MKFGKNLSLVAEISDPEWGPFWINYKLLKKKINDIVSAHGGIKVTQDIANNPNEIAKSQCEKEFFRSLRYELKKASDFFASSEQLYRIRHQRVQEGFRMLKESSQSNKPIDKTTWKLLLSACMKFYKDILLLENFAIMNYVGFSKILKKHDKMTGYITREAFMRNVMSKQNFTDYPFVMNCIKNAQALFEEIQAMESTLGLHDEEKLFIEALRGLNYQASKLQEEEKDSTTLEPPVTTDAIIENTLDLTKPGLGQKLTKGSALFPTGTTSEGKAMAELDQATSKAMEAAAKMSSFSYSPNLQIALSWIEAIQRKDPEVPVKQKDGSSRGSSVDRGSIHSYSDDNIIISGKRKNESEDPVIIKKLFPASNAIETT